MEMNPSELVDTVFNSGVSVRLVIDRIIDPSEIQILLEHATSVPETIMIKTLDNGTITIVELAQILGRLGFQVEHEEL